MLNRLLQLVRGPFRPSPSLPRTERIPRFETLGNRDMCAVNITYNPSNGDTRIIGDAGANVVKVEAFSRNGTAMHRFTVGGTVVATHPRGDFIRFDGLGGDDSFDASTVSVPIVAYGGDGADTIRTGTAYDKVYGGAGNDVIRGNAGNDVLYGGDGNDQLFGGTGNDWLYGQAGADLLNTVDGNAKLSGDRIVNPQLGIDTIQRDRAEPVAASATIVDPHTNHVRFNGQVVDLNATETQDIYDARIDGKGYGLWRDDVGWTVVNAYNLTVDAVISDGQFAWNMLG